MTDESTMSLIAGPFQDPEGTVNCLISILENEDGERVLRTDILLDKVNGESVTGKSLRIASTVGPFTIEDGTQLSINLNKRKGAKIAPKVPRGSLT